MELIRQQLLYRKKTAEAMLQVDETADSIIPDTLADVERILDVSPLVMVRDKQPRQDALSIKMNAVVTVLYLPENGEGICSVQVPMTFTLADTVENITPSSELLCVVSDSQAQARMINPRKLSVHLTAAVKAAAYDNVRELITAGVSGEGSDACEVRTNEIESLETTAAVSRNFNVSDEVSYPLPAAQVERIVKYRTEIEPVEVKTVNNKVAVKGEIHVASLALTKEQKLERASFSVPFTQIIDVSGASEASEPRVRLSLRSFDAAPASEAAEDRLTLVVTVGVCADILITDAVKREILQDLYSVREALSTRSEGYRYAAVSAAGSRTHTMRETIELGSPAMELVEVALSMPEDIIVPEHEDETAIPVVCNLIFTDENGAYQSASRRLYVKPGALMPGSYRISRSPVSAQIGADATVTVSSDVTLTPGGDAVMETEQIVEVTSNGALETQDDLAVLIRRIEPGDTLWEVAKQYHVAGSVIKAVNKTEQDALTVGSMLVIPMSR